MDFEIVERINISKNCKKIGAFLYDPEIDGLYHDSPWWFPVQIGVTHGLTKCQVTPMFLQLPFILKGWINEQILMRQIELLSLVKQDKILMHGSCVDNTLIVGFPNSGKTYQTYKMVAAKGTLISEEYTVIEKHYPNTNPNDCARVEGECFSIRWDAWPYKLIMRTCFSARTMKDCGIKTSLYEKLWLACATLREKLFPFMYEAVIWKNIPATGGFTKIKKIVYGSSGREVTDWKEFAILCENEFPFMSSEFLQAYAVASGFDILGIQEKQRKLIKEFVESVYPK